MSFFKLNKKLSNDSFFVCNFLLCKLLIINNANIPWFILVPRRYNISEIFQLSLIDRKQLESEVNELSLRLSKAFKADKMNIAALGNIVNQLHIHIIVRKKTDLYWPNSIWGKGNSVKYTFDRKEIIKSKVKNIISDLIIL